MWLTQGWSLSLGEKEFKAHIQLKGEWRAVLAILSYARGGVPHCDTSGLFSLPNPGGLWGPRAGRHQLWVCISLYEGKALLGFQLYEGRALSRPHQKTVTSTQVPWPLKQDNLPMNTEASTPPRPSFFKVIGLSHLAVTLILPSLPPFWCLRGV